jgi:hypothetical protein
MNKPDTVEEIEKRLKEATPGPWMWNVNLKAITAEQEEE